MAHLAHDFLQIRARSEALLLEASDFRFLTEQLLLEELDAAALVRALGLKQRILARPLGGRPLGHQSSRKAGSVRPRSGLLQEPCLHAPEGRRGSHLFEQLRRFEIIKAKRELGMFFSSTVRLREDLTELRHPQAENSVLFSALPGSLAVSVDDFVEAAYPLAEISVLALPLQAAQYFIEELLIKARDAAALVRALCRLAGGRWAIRAAARQGASSSAHAAGFSRSHACTRRKAAEEVISLSSCGGSKSLKREGEKTRARDLSFFRFRQSTPSSGSAAAAVPERAPEAGAPTRNSITRSKGAEPGGA